MAKHFEYFLSKFVAKNLQKSPILVTLRSNPSMSSKNLVSQNPDLQLLLVSASK